jgi:hypothetical protein
MLNTSQRWRSHGGHATRGVFLSLNLMMSAAVVAGGPTVSVPPPNGSDDTANIQSALNACVSHGSGCTVQLQAGRYLSSQLVTYGFQGIFKGMGQQKTTIEALPALPVTLPDPFANGECAPNTRDCLWPSLIIFVDGNMSVSDLTVSVPSVPATQTWYGAGAPYTALNDGIRFMGKSRTNATVRRVSFEGAPDSSATSCPVYNFCNAVSFAGEFPRTQTPFDYYFLSGTLSVTNSYFNNVQLGVVADAFLKNVTVVIGGSRLTGNVFETVDLAGPFLTTSDNSLEEVSYNTVSTNSDSYLAPVTIVPWIPSVFVPTKPSTYLIHDNILKAPGPNADGIYIVDGPSSTTVNAFVYDNAIEVQGTAYDAIGAYSTAGTFVANNRTVGTGADAIGIWGGTQAAVLVNDVTGFTPNPASGLAQIVLDGSLQSPPLPDTSNSLIVCKTPADSVLNLGVGNTLVGCQPVAAAIPRVADATVVPRQKLRRGTTRLMP